MFIFFQEPYWHSIYEYLLKAINENDVLDAGYDNLMDYFDLYLTAENHLNNEISILIALFQSILYHSNENHFQYFVK